MRAISAAVEVSSAIGAIARRAMARPAKNARAVPASTPTSSPSSTRATVASVADTRRPYWMTTSPMGSSEPLIRTGAARLMTR